MKGTIVLWKRAPDADGSHSILLLTIAATMHLAKSLIDYQTAVALAGILPVLPGAYLNGGVRERENGPKCPSLAEFRVFAGLEVHS